MINKISKSVNIVFNSKKGAKPEIFHSISQLKSKNYLLLFSTLVCCVTVFIFPFSIIDLSQNTIQAGNIAEKSIKAKRTFLFEDKNLTEDKRKRVALSVLPVFDFEPEQKEKVSSRVIKAFETLHKEYEKVLPDYKDFTYLNDEIDLRLIDQEVRNQLDDKEKKLSLSNFEKTEAFDLLIKKFQEDLGVEIDLRSLKTLKWHHYNYKIKEVILDALSIIYENGVTVKNGDKLSEIYPNGIILKNLATEKEEKTTELRDFYSQSNLGSEIKTLIDLRIDDKHKWLKRAMVKVIQKLVKPNILYDKVETEKRRTSATADIKPVFISVQKGEMIVREGEAITESHIDKINTMKGTEEEGIFLNNIFGSFLFALFLCFGLFLYFAKFQPDIKKDFQHLTLFCLIYISSFFLFKCSLLIGSALYGAYAVLTPNFSVFLVPFAALTILMSIFFSKSSVMMATLTLSAYSLVYFDVNPLLTLIIITSGFVTFYRVHQFSEKTSVIKLGTLIGGANVAVIIIYGILKLNEPSAMFYESFAGLLAGIFAAVIVSAAVPVIESYFNTTSDIKLLELSDFNHPLLREMVIKAPGTYHHSIMVGTLSEEAAKKIGANHLLARVGSYFHDIGKMSKPHYFIENMRNEKNRHEKLSPTMSALILQDHVKEGVELAKKHNLIPVIQEFIREHHGTSLIQYFYNKALQTTDRDALEAIKDTSFSYAGPTPRSKETAIVSMADSLEAASRTLDKPNPSNIRALVDKIVDGKKEHKQLDQTPLTFNDLKAIKESFVTTLTNMFHSRIDYPEDEQAKQNKTNKQNKSKDESKVQHLDTKKKSVGKENNNKPLIIQKNNRENINAAAK
ncbi:MAG: HDIG domain-containing protein [Nitrospinae bacterium]|nr:HDIG domain-containing protein [Nitrospinota bacterium]